MTTPDGHDILHIATPAEWDAALGAGEVAPASLATEGFVHCSTRAQLAVTLARHFAGAGELVLLRLDPDMIAANLRWDESHPGEHFPHVCTAIPLAAVAGVERVTSPGA